MHKQSRAYVCESSGSLDIGGEQSMCVEEQLEPRYVSGAERMCVRAT